MADEVDKETISRVMREMGRKGGKAKVKKGFAAMSEEQLKRVSAKAVKARNKKRSAKNAAAPAKRVTKKAGKKKALKQKN